MKLSLLSIGAWFAAEALCPALQPISEAARHLDQVLDAMHVMEHWHAGQIVNWKTGDPTGQPVTDGGSHTHCSQFAAATCDRLGVYLLHPPEHDSKLLANAQYDWLSGKGQSRGWKPVADGVAAQDMANAGQVVVAVYKNADPKKHGHIAIVRPGLLTPGQIEAEGPNIIQAGGHNFECASLKRGFSFHPGAFEGHQIRFFSHVVK